MADIHDALIQLGFEGRRRIRVADELGMDYEPDAVGPRRLILLEEINATMRQLARYWEKTRVSGDPKVSPAVDALMEILFMGRQVRMHVLLVAQSATARALGGPEVREQFYTRIMARYTVNAWRMLAPEIQPIPKSTKHKGRAQVVMGGTARETQVLFFTEAEARGWATSSPAPAKTKKRPTGPSLASSAVLQNAAVDLQAAAPAEATPALPGFPEIPVHPALPAHQENAANPDGTTTATTSPTIPGAAPDDAVVGLREAHRRHLPEITLAALRYARANDPTFPDPAGKRGAELLYRVGDLKRWARNRPRAAVGITDLR
ncbi:hypothetical protein Q3V23_00050 [Streptomyces sp. VNUA116]|uniref:hypothetical protein n=1 Tax=Streptomyces sp. VNUA116 TaxID=3062449 RepID=UPI0026775329|nr:hypothetical protein [Streptomyces sp. VNUA116]WKU49092.1 hypothetical protein Q3V23_00050 [Streptomyces sp. VNUA116]